MDDATVEEVFEDNQNVVPPDQSNVYPRILVNQNPSFINLGIEYATFIFQNYGWLILFALVLLFYFKNKLQARFSRYQQSQSQTQDLHRYDHNEIQQRQEAMGAARRKLQENYQQATEKHKEEQDRINEEKRKERIADWDRHQEGKGYKSKSFQQGKPTDPKDKNNNGKPPATKPGPYVYRNIDYNPLTGNPGGATYRPVPRKGAGGGG